MEVKEAQERKINFEVELYKAFKDFEEETGLEIAAILVQRLDASEMGGSRKSILGGIEIVAGVDVPATPKEAM